MQSKRIIPALTPDSLFDPSPDKCKIIWPQHHQTTGDCGSQMGDKCKIMRTRKSCSQSTYRRVKRMGDRWKTSVKSCGQSTHGELETVGDKWETSVKIMRPKELQETGESGAQVGDKWETSVKSCGQSTHKGLETVEDRWRAHGKSGLETVGDKWGQV